MCSRSWHLIRLLLFLVVQHWLNCWRCSSFSHLFSCVSKSSGFYSLLRFSTVRERERKKPPLRNRGEKRAENQSLRWWFLFRCEETSLYGRPPLQLLFFQTQLGSTLITLALVQQDHRQEAATAHASSLPRGLACTGGPPSEPPQTKRRVQDVDSCREHNSTSDSERDSRKQSHQCEAVLTYLRPAANAAVRVGQVCRIVRRVAPLQ